MKTRKKLIIRDHLAEIIKMFGFTKEQWKYLNIKQEDNKTNGSVRIDLQFFQFLKCKAGFNARHFHQKIITKTMTYIIRNYIEELSKVYKLSEEETLELMKMADEDINYLYHQIISNA